MIYGAVDVVAFVGSLGFFLNWLNEFGVEAKRLRENEESTIDERHSLAREQRETDSNIELVLSIVFSQSPTKK